MQTITDPSGWSATVEMMHLGGHKRARVVITAPDELDPAELAELYKNLRDAEDAGDFRSAAIIEKQLDDWFDTHEEAEDEE